MASKARAQANLLGSDGKIKATQFGTGSITSDFIDSDFTTSITTNPEFSGTEAARMPIGTTDQRTSAQSGDIRFNSTLNLMEYYDGTLWKAIDAPPSIISISPEIFSAAGTTITITGSNFQSGVNVRLIDTDGVELTPDSVTLVSSSSITFDTTQAMVDNEKDKFDVRVANVSGLSGTFENVLEISDGTFSFTSSATSTLYDSGRSSGFAAGGSVSGGGGESDFTISYAVTSGSLPSGGSISSSTGNVTGISAVGSDTVSNFTVTATATDTSSQTSSTYTRSFALTVKAPVTQTYNYTGSNVSFSVPSGVTAITATMWGGAGGYGNAEGYSDAGGAGGFSTGTINVASISTLIIQVGQGGGSGETSRPSRPYPAGGLPALRSGYVSGAGGGRSAIFDGSVSHANSLIIAGGGGGAAGHGGGGPESGSNLGGGSGGGTTGEDGWGLSNRTAGGTQSAGGTMVGKTGQDGTSSGPLQGGDAGNGNLWSTGWNAAGGGGDGYYGGGARESNHAGGGGGSGYIHPTLVTNSTTSANTQTNGKKTTTNPASTDNQYWSSGIAVGRNNGSGGNGKVVLTY